MGFNSAFKGLKLLKNPGNGRLNNLNDSYLNVLNTPTEISSLSVRQERMCYEKWLLLREKGG